MHRRFPSCEKYPISSSYWLDAFEEGVNFLENATTIAVILSKVYVFVPLLKFHTCCFLVNASDGVSSFPAGEFCVFESRQHFGTDLAILMVCWIFFLRMLILRNLADCQKSSKITQEMLSSLPFLIWRTTFLVLMAGCIIRL